MVLTNCFSTLYKDKNYVLETVLGGGGKRTQTCIHTKGRDANNMYMEEMNYIESW